MEKILTSGHIGGRVSPPCSKSYAQRALAAALLAEGRSVLRNLEFCDDTLSAIRCIETLGARVTRIGADALAIDGGLRQADISDQRHAPYGRIGIGDTTIHPYRLACRPADAHRR